MALTPQKRKLNQVLSTFGAFFVTGAIFLCLLFILPRTEASLLLIIGVSGGSGFLTHRFFSRKYRRRRKTEKAEFPEKWRKILQGRVAFYRALKGEERKKFEDEVQVFLQEKRVTGIRLKLTDTDRLLVAASAVIPIFGFPEWEYDDLGEVLVYPDNFDADFQFMNGRGGSSISGMVGSGGYMDKVMILSRPSLLHGFSVENDKRNVGVHEFAHLVDKADGSIDGVPSAWMDSRWVKPWEKLMEQKIAEIRAGKSDIDPYGGTKPEEFFAVTSEYFFEAPELLEKKHPKLYKMLERIFHQDPSHRFTQAVKEMIQPYGRKIGRNDPCPCGSGQKYKKCCLE